MDTKIAQLNIEFFRRRLAEESDPGKRAMIERLLAEEIAKLESPGEERDRNDGC